MNVRFVEWKPEPVREKDLPEGVRYKYTGSLKSEYVAASGTLRTQVADYCGTPCHQHASKRDDSPVTILDWPSWCGPRPEMNTRPTYKQIVERSPSQSAYFLFATLNGWKYTSGPVSLFVGDDSSVMDTFLGWLVIE